jgi:hypothetical protein
VRGADRFDQRSEAARRRCRWVRLLGLRGLEISAE